MLLGHQIHHQDGTTATVEPAMIGPHCAALMLRTVVTATFRVRASSFPVVTISGRRNAVHPGCELNGG